MQVTAIILNILIILLEFPAEILNRIELYIIQQRDWYVLHEN
jgi:hypothetical protein